MYIHVVIQYSVISSCIYLSIDCEVYLGFLDFCVTPAFFFD